MGLRMCTTKVVWTAGARVGKLLQSRWQKRHDDKKTAARECHMSMNRISVAQAIRTDAYGRITVMTLPPGGCRLTCRKDADDASSNKNENHMPSRSMADLGLRDSADFRPGG
ncbi:MAG: hypothetical protein ROZ09_03160 [Thiobacillus sp.]|jgi:hypothetical protein|uniref:hypothetical protein n=1 Tax=Thiobacillus sp. TaxID=924 RepID=UPI002895E746|nr:hypothetical protein [Thiobacillus sp.]MDT3705799.1 hypothetical protein [Thiobacillus sp.]